MVLKRHGKTPSGGGPDDVVETSSMSRNRNIRHRKESAPFPLNGAMASIHRTSIRVGYVHNYAKVGLGA